MDDGTGIRTPSVDPKESILIEWSLLVKAFEAEIAEASQVEAEVEVTYDLKQLSKLRQSLNQRLEIITKELELQKAKNESLKLVGGDPTLSEKRIEILLVEGQKISEELHDLQSRLNLARDKNEGHQSNI